MLERREAASARRHPERHAHCPLCGEERADQLLRDVTGAEDALCPHPCAAAWRTLAALRCRESVNEVLASRRRLEYEAGQPFAPVLSELLLDRWRAGTGRLCPRIYLHGSRLRAAARVSRRWRREPSASTRLSRSRRTCRRRRSPFLSPRGDRRQGREARARVRGRGNRVAARRHSSGPDRSPAVRRSVDAFSGRSEPEPDLPWLTR
jgi:hypothetical protein